MVLALPLLLLFAVFTWQVGAEGPLLTADERFGPAVRHVSPPAPLAEFLADLGNPGVAVTVLVLAMAWSGLRTRRWWPVWWHALAMAAVPVAVGLLKAWLDRPGPLGGSGYYPSGHGATAVVAFGGAALLLHGSSGAGGRLGGSVGHVVGLLLVAACGAGLVWRGYHWPLDVLASWCLGGLLLIGARAAVRHGPPRRGRRRSAAPGRE